MKNLHEQLIRISEIMGLPENAHFIREEKELLNEQLSFIRKLFGQDFSDLPPTWRINRQGSRIRSIDIPDDQGRFVGRIEAEPKHWTELENALSNQTVRLKDLSVGARKLLWKLYKQAPPNQTTGTAISKADELYKDLMQELSGGVKGVTELNFLRNISDDIAPSTTGVRMTLKDALMKRLGDEDLVDILMPYIDKRLKYYQKKVLVNVGEDVMGQLTHAESVKAFRAKQALTGTQLTAFENKLKNPKKIDDDLLDIQQAQGDLFDALKYIQTGKKITPELEDFILKRMNEIYERKQSLTREIEDFISGLRKSGDEDFERIADILDDIKTKNGGVWDIIAILPHQEPTWLKIWYATKEGFNAGRSIDFLKGFRFLGRKMQGLYNKTKNLVKREKVDEINNSVNNEIAKEIGPNWTKAVIGGSSRGMPWWSKGPSTKSSLRSVVDYYKPLRNLTDAQRKNYYPGWSYFVELFTRNVKYSLYYTLIKAVGTGVDIIFKRLNKDEVDCFNQILKFFREKGITDEEEILKYLTGVGTLTDEDEEILKNEKIQEQSVVGAPNFGGVVDVSNTTPETEKIGTESGGVTRKILEKNVPCVQVMLPLTDKQKLRKWYKLLDLYLSGDSDAVYGDRTPVEAELYENFKQSLGIYGWDSPLGVLSNAALAFTTVDDWIRVVGEVLDLASTPQEIRELTDLERAAMEQGLFGNEVAFEAYCTKEGLKYVGWTTIGRVGRGCASISQERQDEYVQYEYKAGFGWKSTGDSCDENFGPRMKDVINKTDTLSKSSVTPDSLPQNTTPQPPIPNVPKKMTPEEKKRILDSLRKGDIFNED